MKSIRTRLRGATPLDGVSTLLLIAAIWLVARTYWVDGLPPATGPAQLATGPIEDAMVGARAPILPVTTLGGVLDSLDLGASGSQLIVVGERSCPACQVSMPVWAGVATELRLGMRFVIVSPDSQQLTAPLGVADARVVHAHDGGAIVRAFNSPAYPVTLATDSDGTVRFARIGILRTGDREAILKVLD